MDYEVVAWLRIGSVEYPLSAEQLKDMKDAGAVREDGATDGSKHYTLAK